MPSEMPYCGGHPEYKGVGCPLCVVARERVAGMKADASRLAAVEAERDAAVARAERLRRLVIPPLRQLYGATILVRDPPFMPTPEMLGEKKTATEYQAWRTAYAVVLDLARALAADASAGTEGT